MMEQIRYAKRGDEALRASFQKAMTDPTFKALVGEIGLKEEILAKYTSTLENCAEEYGHCLRCPGLTACRNQIMGYAYLPRVEEGSLTFEYQMCRYLREQKKEHAFEKNVYAYQISGDIREARFSKIYTNDKKRLEVIAWIDRFMTNYETNSHQKGLYLYGNFGCGKTYLLAALLNEMARREVRSAIIFWPEFLRDLKSSFQTDFHEKIERLKRVPLLLIDDIGAENTTAWGRDEIFCPIIQYRMEESLPTFFTSNLDLEALEHHFEVSKESVDSVKARRIIERIRQLTEQKEMVSKNLRK